MFKSGFIRLRNVYNSISKLYTLIIVQHPLATIICYILLMTSFSLGLFQLKFDADSESLTELHSSRSRRHKQYLDEIFPLRQDEGFLQYRLTNMGYYVEVIIKTKNGTMFSKENQRLFEEYYKFFDLLMDLDVIDTGGGDGEVYSYKYNQLCASRLGKCAVEGGLVRTESFRRNFINRQVSYEAADAKMMYMDTEAADGISVGFTFGTSPRQKCRRKQVSDTSKETKLICTVTGFNIIRNRLDLKFKDAEDRRKAIIYMHQFVKHMQSIKTVNLYPDFEFSYHTSHTLQSEIEYYSQFDLKYMALMFLGFWTVFFMLMWLDVSLFRNLLFRSNTATDHQPKSSCLLEWFDKINWFFINSSGLLIIVTVIQYFATIIATLGLMSLFGVAANQILYTIVIVLMFTVCHQSILLFKTIKNMNKKLPMMESQSQIQTRKQSMVQKPEAKKTNETAKLSEHKENISTDIVKVIDELDEISSGIGTPKSNKSKHLDEGDFSSDDKEKLIRAIQQIMVPGFCTLMISMFSYFLIGLTNGYDAIRIYCFFMAVCLLINFFGLLAFYCPCLVLHLKRVKTNRNCLLFCYKHAPFSPKAKANLNGLNNSSTVINLDSSVDEDQLAQMAAKKSKTSRAKSAWSSVRRFFASINTNNVDFLKYKKLKVALLLVFIGYFAFNFTITITRLKINLPMLDLLPQQSYLYEHMKNHMAYFKLGPVIILNFVKPMKYWETSTKDKILSMVDDMKSLKGMSQLEINWLRDVYDGMTNEYNIEFKDQCNQEKLEYYNYTNCFASVLGEYLNEEQNREDVVFKLNLGPEMNKKPEVHDYKLMVHQLDKVVIPNQLLIKSSRIYLSLADFKGVRFEADLLNSLKDLAAERYNLTEDTLIIYTSIGSYLEQLDEIYPTVISIFLIFFECIFFGCLVLIFDLRTMFLHIINMLSVFLAILANMFLFDLSLNVATLLQLIMLPALLNEFFVYPTYLYLYMSERKRPHRQLTHNYKLSALKSLVMLKIKSYSCTMTINENETVGLWWNLPSNRRRIARANFAYAKSSKHSVHLLLASLVFSISFLYYCQTYNFNALFAILSSSFFNLVVHLYIFYPILLNIFGPNWS